MYNSCMDRLKRIPKKYLAVTAGLAMLTGVIACKCQEVKGSISFTKTEITNTVFSTRSESVVGPTFTPTPGPTPESTATSFPALIIESTPIPGKESAIQPPAIKNSLDLMKKALSDLAKERDAEKAAQIKGWGENIDPDLNNGRTNIVILGTGSEDTTNKLADSIQFISIKGDDVGIFHFPRDLAVSYMFKKYGPRNSRINEVEARENLGAMRYVLEEFGLSVHGILKVNYTFLEPAVNLTIGTVPVNVERAIYDPSFETPFQIKAGHHQLDGANAVKLSRSRYGGSDYTRINYQQQIAEALGVGILTKPPQASEIARYGQLFKTFSDQVKSGESSRDFDLLINGKSLFDPRSGAITDLFSQGPPDLSNLRIHKLGTFDHLLRATGFGPAINQFAETNLTDPSLVYVEPGRRWIREQLRASTRS